VVIPLTIQRYPMLQRNLVYTGVTRGKRLVVLIGQRKYQKGLAWVHLSQSRSFDQRFRACAPLAAIARV
jgi:ATP-dependent exoDNAse (exonuclease V) alpha subunit